MPDVKAFLDNPPPDFVPLQFALIHEKYVLNRIVVASLHGTSTKKVMFERLSDLDEVWVLCVRKPQDLQWRFFGRFVERGIFVVVIHKSRIECGTREQYALCVAEFQAKWLEVFGNHDCLTGHDCEAFFGEMVSDVDAE